MSHANTHATRIQVCTDTDTHLHTLTHAETYVLMNPMKVA